MESTLIGIIVFIGYTCYDNLDWICRRLNVVNDTSFGHSRINHISRNDFVSPGNVKRTQELIDKVKEVEATFINIGNYSSALKPTPPEFPPCRIVKYN